MTEVYRVIKTTHAYSDVHNKPLFMFLTFSFITSWLISESESQQGLIINYRFKRLVVLWWVGLMGPFIWWGFHRGLWSCVYWEEHGKVASGLHCLNHLLIGLRVCYNHVLLALPAKHWQCSHSAPVLFLHLSGSFTCSISAPPPIKSFFIWESLNIKCEYPAMKVADVRLQRQSCPRFQTLLHPNDCHDFPPWETCTEYATFLHLFWPHFQQKNKG